MRIILWIFFSTIIVSIISLIGVITLGMKSKSLKNLIMILVSLSAGALIGGAFIHLIPESLNSLEQKSVFVYVLGGFILFFVTERVLKWRHCHDKKCKIHTFAYMNLFGEAIHNFIDGIIIAAAFITSIPLGISATIAVAMHEIPQELGDFGVLIHGGYKKSQAILLNFLIALTAIAGGIFGYLAHSVAQLSLGALLPIAAGGFIYIGASDLIPEIRKEENMKKAIIHIIIFITGIALMYLLKTLLEI